MNTYFTNKQHIKTELKLVKKHKKVLDKVKKIVIIHRRTWEEKKES